MIKYEILLPDDVGDNRCSGTCRSWHKCRPRCLPVVPGAKPVTVEHIKIHGTALEGNLEGDAVDRDVFVFLAAQLRQREITAAIPSSMRCTVIPSAPSSGPTRSTCRRPSKALSPRARKR